MTPLAYLFISAALILVDGGPHLQRAQGGRLMCDHRLWGEPDGLLCVRTGTHDTHQYASSTGSDVDDHHADGGHG